MRIIVIGASGTIGRAILDLLSANHEIITVGKTSGQHHVDFADPKSIKPCSRQSVRSTR